jgi:hypothetical protein
VKTQYVKICGIPIYRIKIPYWKKKKPKPMTSDFTLSNGKKEQVKPKLDRRKKITTEPKLIKYKAKRQ